ncbi:uncharacterized protein BJ171DRAFT_567759, partial [Polychytrium aggregatum]|uniref:uncharacterized protein n=1 Tax=Polychytrium aggregatum TaxID=110093 RepID=UPI0022FF0D81
MHTRPSIRITPQIVHFPCPSLNTSHLQTITIQNVSKSKLRVLISVVASPVFKLHLKKKGDLIPGDSEELDVIFNPPEWIYYHDVVTIYSSAGDAYQVSLHGYPAIRNIIPKQIRFDPCPIGEAAKQIIMLRSQIPVEFDYEFYFEDAPEPNPFTVWPRKGTNSVLALGTWASVALVLERFLSPLVLPGTVHVGSETPVTIQFSPTNLRKTTARLGLMTSQLAAQPHCCRLIGTTQLLLPDLLKAHDTESEETPTAPMEATHSTASERKHGRRRGGKRRRPSTKTKKTAESSPVKERDLFAMDVQNRKELEKSKELRRFVCLGEGASSVSVPIVEDDNVVVECLEDNLRVVPSAATVFNNTRVVIVNEQSLSLHHLSRRDDGEWQNQQRVENLFYQAVCTVIIRKRADRRLAKLKRLFETDLDDPKSLTTRSKPLNVECVSHILDECLAMGARPRTAPPKVSRRPCFLTESPINAVDAIKHVNLLSPAKLTPVTIPYEIQHGYKPIERPNPNLFSAPIPSRSLRALDTTERSSPNRTDLSTETIPELFKKRPPGPISSWNPYADLSQSRTPSTGYTETDPEYSLCAKGLLSLESMSTVQDATERLRKCCIEMCLALNYLEESDSRLGATKEAGRPSEVPWNSVDSGFRYNPKPIEHLPSVPTFDLIFTEFPAFPDT